MHSLADVYRTAHSTCCCCVPSPQRRGIAGLVPTRAVTQGRINRGSHCQKPGPISPRQSSGDWVVLVPYIEGRPKLRLPSAPASSAVQSYSSLAKGFNFFSSVETRLRNSFMTL